MSVVIPDMIQTDKMVFCPFCLGKHQLSKFLISTKHGYSRKLGKCPECENGMLLETLARMLKWNATEYAEFAYYYPNALFWKKVSSQFNKWKQKLYDLGMAQQFWGKYKELKQQNAYSEYTQIDTEENYNEFLERQKNRQESGYYT